MVLTFERDPKRYRHWSVTYEPPVATVTMQVDPAGGLDDSYELKSNSYDLAVDIELADIVQRLRFEHPEIGAVLLTGGLDKLFCAGANIQMLASASHHHKVNFCKFTNETRHAIEDASVSSGQVWLAALNGVAAGGGYEVALACDEIILVDDRASTVALPEVPLLGVLPGTGGLTRLVDKRHVRRDRADVFCTKAEGVRAKQALDWGLIDSSASRSEWQAHIRDRALTRAGATDRPAVDGIELTPLTITADETMMNAGDLVAVEIDRTRRAATITVRAPSPPVADDVESIHAAGSSWWPLAVCRQLEAAVLHLRFNEASIGTWVLQTEGDPEAVLAADRSLRNHGDDWFVREVRLYWARTLSRLDLSARTLLALITPGGAFVGLLAELALAADRTLMLDGTWEDDELGPAALQLTETNLDLLPMVNGLSRLATRFWGDPAAATIACDTVDKPLSAEEAAETGLVTDTPDDIDWDDDVRLFLEERASFSPDALTGMEANLRFVGPETMDTKIFARLSAWQNWIFQRPNAAGPDGALQRYGSGSRPHYDPTRI